MLSQWVANCAQTQPAVRIAWLSLDEGDNDPTRFLACLVAAHLGAGVLALLQSPQPPPTEALLTLLLNDLTPLQEDFLLVLDDKHGIEAQAVEQALAFLLEHLPPRMHLVIATRQDPPLPLARYRVRGQLSELRFTPAEATEFLNPVMGLHLAGEDIAALETRTEGWIAGLQLATLALQGLADQEPLSGPGQSEVTGFIQSFSGSHHFVLDYLLEEVLQQQPAGIQTFLLRTSILDRLCGPLYDAVVLDATVTG